MTKKLEGRSNEYYTAFHKLVMNGVTYGQEKIILDTGDSESQQKWWLNKLLEDEIRLQFNNYVASRKQRVILLRGKSTGKPLVLPYTTRFDGNYRNKVKYALRGVHIIRGTLLTLTCALADFDNLIDATRALKQGWNRVRNQIKLRFGHLSYLMVTEFGGKNNAPHLHLVLDNIEFDEDDIGWLRKLWKKHVGTFINVKKIYNIGAANYVLKYLQKTFNHKGNVAKSGNAWCYWITNAKFYSISADLAPGGSKIDRFVSDILDEMELCDLICNYCSEENYEYIGVCYKYSVKDPPEKMTDAWLLKHGWFYNDELCYWESPDVF